MLMPSATAQERMHQNHYDVLILTDMVSSSLRLTLCLIIGAFTGTVLGFLFVPDPTSPLGPVLAASCAAVLTAFLYQSNWLRE